MNAVWIITVVVIFDELQKAGGHFDHKLTKVSDAEILTVAIVSAKYFQNHHERALLIMKVLGYLSGELSVSRFNRRLHKSSEWLDQLELEEYRKSIETRNSQIEKMGIERLYARTNDGFEIKVQASVFALAISNMK